MLNALFDALGLFPCPGCGGSGGGCHNFCPACLARFRRFTDPRCPGCGGELDGMLAQCSKCLAEGLHPWIYAASCFAYEGFGKDMILKFKFGDSPELARPFGHMAAEILRQCGEKADFLCAIPLHCTRYYRRTFNQSELFARIAAKELRLPFRQVLYRTRPTPHQAELPRKERLNNLKGAFALYPFADVRKQHVWIADDVFTTGSTLHEAAKVLLESGAASVRVLTLARA